MWWKQFVEKSHNRLARELVVERGLGLGEAARLFALLNVSVFDGYVASFDGKFHYNHWRPYTAIRWAAEDGNPDTEADTAWTNLHDHTYAFPSYPSAHGTVCAAAMTVMADTFGEDVPFEMTIREADVAGPMSGHVPLDPATRSFTSFDEAAEECALSRVYLGIHFRYDSEAGTVLGRRIGEMAVRDFLPPTR
jgi:membrane-associated phospholipid phosphatase